MTVLRASDETATARRARLDGFLRITDVTIGFAIVAAGVFALIVAPTTVQREVTLPALVTSWGLLLILGGLSATVGRLTGIWIMETVGIVAAATGVLIFIGVLGVTVGRTPTAGAALCIMWVAFACLVRRYIELQLFLSEPGERGLVGRILGLVKTRTPAPGHRR